MARKQKKTNRVKKLTQKAYANITAYYRGLGYSKDQVIDALYCNSL